MQPIAVDLMLLRGAAPDLALTNGRALMARVLERGPTSVGVINLAGAILTAELPDHVRAGDRLRLIVRETTSERVLLQIAPPAAQQPVAPGLVPPAPVQLRWPGGGVLAVLEREGADGGAGDERGTVTLRYDAPSLGTVQLRIALDAAGVRAHVALDPGVPLALGERAAQQLRDELARAAGRPARVVVEARHDPLDVYA